MLHRLSGVFNSNAPERHLRKKLSSLPRVALAYVSEEILRKPASPWICMVFCWHPFHIFNLNSKIGWIFFVGAPPRVSVTVIFSFGASPHAFCSIFFFRGFAPRFLNARFLAKNHAMWPSLACFFYEAALRGMKEIRAIGGTLGPHF